MTVETDRLRELLNDALEIVAMTDTRGRELVAPIFKEIMTLRDQGMPEDTVNVLLDALKQCCQFNSEMRARAHAVCNTLDELSRAQPGGVAQALTIKGAARALRPALRVLHDPQAFTAGEYIAATRMVDEVAVVVSRERLLSASMRHELRSRAFRTLSSYLHRPEGVGPVAATICGGSHLEAVTA